MVKTSDTLLKVCRTGETYQISAPSAKSTGGRYYLNRKVLEAAEQDFVKWGGEMCLRGISQDKAVAVMNALRDQGYGFMADNHRDEARKFASSPSGATGQSEDESHSPEP